MKSSFLPKYEPNVIRISALFCATLYYRAEICTTFGSCFWKKWTKIIFKSDFELLQLWIIVSESSYEEIATRLFYFQALIKHLEDEDVEAFTTEVKNFDQISRLDQWFTTILLRIKKQMPDDNELC